MGTGRHWLAPPPSVPCLLAEFKSQGLSPHTPEAVTDGRASPRAGWGGTEQEEPRGHKSGSQEHERPHVFLGDQYQDCELMRADPGPYPQLACSVVTDSSPAEPAVSTRDGHLGRSPDLCSLSFHGFGGTSETHVRLLAQSGHMVPPYLPCIPDPRTWAIHSPSRLCG